MTLYLGNNLISGVQTLVGESRNIGQIIPSAIPLTDAGLHLLDGALIQGGGIYSAFVDYIADLYTANPSANYFTTEALWQQSVTTYGVCGKFVYDSVNNTVRLPKVTGIIEGTTDVSALGDLVEAGLPNITGEFNSAYNSDNLSGAFGWQGGMPAQGTTNSSYIGGFNFDASRSSSIYGNSSTVQPQTIKVLYYIVIATSTKTDIQVDIDEVVTDLNSKADTDLTNVPNSKGILTESYVNGTSWYRIYSDGFCIQGGRQTASTTKVSLLVNYANTNYTVITNSGYNNTNAIYNQYNPYVLYTDGFGITWTDTLRFNQWVAYGYIR